MSNEIKINDKIKEAILASIKDDRERNIISQILSGKTQRSCLRLGSETEYENNGYVNGVVKKCIPYVDLTKSKKYGISIDMNAAPDWLRAHESVWGTAIANKNEQQTIPNIATVTEPKRTITIDFEKREAERIENEKSAIEMAVNERLEREKEKILADLKSQIESEVSEKYEKIISDKVISYDKRIETLTKQHVSAASELKIQTKLATVKEFQSIYAKQVEGLEQKNNELKDKLERASQEHRQQTELLQTEAAKLIETEKKLIVSNKEKVTFEQQIAELNALIEKLTPKKSAEIRTKKIFSIFSILGLFALSLLSIENMIVCFNTTSFMLIAGVIGVFLEFMLWSINFNRFANNTLNNVDDQAEINGIGTVLFVARTAFNAAGGFYIAKNHVQGNEMYKIFGNHFTKIEDVFFGIQLPNDWGYIVITFIIALLVSWLEVKYMPIAMKTAYSLFIKKEE